MQENAIKMRNSGLNYQRVTIDIPIPTFYDENHSNPMKFIWELKQYLEIKNMQCDAEALIIKSVLKGRAKTWYFASITNWDNFDQFRMDLMADFFTLQYKTELVHEWSSGRFSR